MKQVRFAICVAFSFLLCSLFVAGCGSSSHHTLFLIASGTPSVGSFEIGGSGALTFTSNNFSAGPNPQVILIEPQRHYAYLLNNAGPTALGAVLQYSVDRGKGTLNTIQAATGNSGITGPVPPIATGLDPTSMAVDSNSAFVFVANTGSDSISVYSIDSTTGKLTAVANSPFPTGSKPVSLVARSGSLFVANQGAATVSVYAYDKSGALTLTGTPAPATANLTAIEADPSGKNIYVADGTANTVTVYTAGASGPTATSTVVNVGKTPVNLHVDPSGKYLYVANSGDNTVSGFSIDGSGGLTAISGSPFTAGTSPDYITSSQDGSILFVANSGSANVSSFKVSNGGLSSASGSPYAAPGYNSPNGLASLD